MYINDKTMNELNGVQIDIFKGFISLCRKLNLRYFVVHGTLLGALRYNGFFPMDDDIDVAMPREDYDLFIQEGQKLLPEDLFIQSVVSEKEYPLAFAKIRKNETAFIQPALEKCHINKGIYIDVFPIDNYPDDKRVAKRKMWLSRLFNLRVSLIFSDEKKTIRHRFFQFLSLLIIPSWRCAIKKYTDVYRNIPKSQSVIVYGGKTTEIGIPSIWFDDYVLMKFNGIEVRAPKNYDAYLKKIYGNYMTYSPSAKYLNERGEVEISASILDFGNSYSNYK